MKPDARMRLESVSKIWTGAVILRLAQDGRLRPSDTVEQWLPGLLPYGDRITIAQLLTHTSGLIDNNDMAAARPRSSRGSGIRLLRAQLTRVATRARTERAIEYSPTLWIELASWQPLRSTPGTTFHYSNIGFEILGLIASRAAGRDLPSLYRDVIIAPLAPRERRLRPAGPDHGSCTPGISGRAVGRSAHGRDRLARRHRRGGRHRRQRSRDGTLSERAHAGRGARRGLGRADEDGPILDGPGARRLRQRRSGTAVEAQDSRPTSSSAPTASGSAVLLMNGRAGSAGDDRAHRAIWQLYCAG